MIFSSMVVRVARKSERVARVWRQAPLMLVACFVLSGCFRPAFQPQGAPLAGSESLALCSKLTRLHAPPESMRALADATISHGSDEASFRYVIIAKEPSSFRVDVLPINGAFTLGLLTARDGRAVWINTQERSYAEATDERSLLAEYLGLRGVSREIAVALVTGTLPRLSCASVEAYRQSDGTIELLDRDAHVAWSIDAVSGELRGAQLLDQGSRYREVSASLRQKEDGAGRSLVLDIFEPVTAKVSIELVKIVLNPHLDDRLFTVNVPSTYTRE